MKDFNIQFIPWNLPIKFGTQGHDTVVALEKIFRSNFNKGLYRKATQISGLDEHFQKVIDGLQASIGQLNQVSEAEANRIHDLISYDHEHFENHIKDVLAYALEHKHLNFIISPNSYFTKTLAELYQPFGKPMSICMFQGKASNDINIKEQFTENLFQNGSIKRILHFGPKPLSLISKKVITKDYKQLNHALYKGMTHEKFMHQPIQFLNEFVVLHLDLNALSFGKENYPDGAIQPQVFLEVMEQIVATRRKIIGVHIIHNNNSLSSNMLYEFLNDLKQIVGRSTGIFSPQNTFR